MKKQLDRTLTRSGLLAVMAMVIAVGSVQGQSLRYKIKVNIPFDFVVADKKLTAGEYAIGRALQNSGDSLVLISSVDGRVRISRFSTAVESRDLQNKIAIVFHRYGDQYFLSQVWPPGGSTGRALIKSRGEREIERKLAEQSFTPASMMRKADAAETVTIVVDLQ